MDTSKLTRAQKIKLLNDLKTGKVTLKDLVERGHKVEFWHHLNDGNYQDDETGKIFTPQEFETRERPANTIIHRVIFEDFSQPKNMNK